jgi:hypothetical protein
VYCCDETSERRMCEFVYTPYGIEAPACINLATTPTIRRFQGFTYRINSRVWLDSSGKAKIDMNHRNIDFQRFSLAVYNPNSNPAYLHLDRMIDHMHIIHSTSTILSLGVMLIVSFRIRYAFIDDRDEQGIHVSRSIGSVALDMLSFRLHVSKPVAV